MTFCIEKGSGEAGQGSGKGEDAATEADELAEPMNVIEEDVRTRITGGF